MAGARNMLARTLDGLGEAIVAGRHAPGASIPPEPALCEAYGVSRTVVREAVKSLVAKGLVSTGPKVGTRVLPPAEWNWFDPAVVRWQTGVGPTREFLRDLQELRRVLEPASVRMAAQRATASDIAEVEEAYAGMRQAIEHGDPMAADRSVGHPKHHLAIRRRSGRRTAVDQIVDRPQCGRFTP